jgi:uncharacterized membrane protein YtjA (UPF0391 family)
LTGIGPISATTHQRNSISPQPFLPLVGSAAPDAATEGRCMMLKWALIFFLVSIVAGIFGFTNIAAGARTIAKVLFVIALVVMIIFLVLALVAGSAIL